MKSMKPYKHKHSLFKRYLGLKNVIKHQIKRLQIEWSFEDPDINKKLNVIAKELGNMLTDEEAFKLYVKKLMEM